jgi:hypothetical protein
MDLALALCWDDEVVYLMIHGCRSLLVNTVLEFQVLPRGTLFNFTLFPALLVAVQVSDRTMSLLGNRPSLT